MLGQALVRTSDQGITAGLSTISDANRLAITLTKVY